MILIVLAAIWALHAAAAATASNWLWGVDAFSHWPVPAAAILIAIAALGFVPPLAAGLERGLEALGERWSRAGWRADALVGVAVAVGLFLARDPLKMTGDAGLRVGLLGMADPRSLMVLMFPADRALNFTVPRALMGMGWGAETALQFVGALLGGAFAITAVRFLRASGARGRALPAGFVAVAGGALMMHFAGYDKFGPLMLGIALAMLGALRLSRGQGSVWTLAAGVALAVASHRSALLGIPAAGLVWVLAVRSARDGRERFERLMAGVLVAVVCVLVAPMAFSTLVKVDALKHLPGGEVARARAGGGAFQAPITLSHAFNELSFLVPLWLAGAAAALAALPGARRIGRGSADARERGASKPFGLGLPLLLAGGGFLALLLVVEPGGGWARDWDVGTGAGVILALATAHALVGLWREGGARGSAGVATLLGLSIGISIWGIHVSEPIAMRRLDTLATASPPWSAATLGWMYDFRGLHALNRNDPEGAAGSFERAIRIGGPNPRLFYQLGLADLGAGRAEEAGEAFREATRRAPQVAGPWVGLARVALIRRDSVAALAALDSMRSHGTDSDEGRALRRALAEARGEGPGPGAH